MLGRVSGLLRPAARAATPVAVAPVQATAQRWATTFHKWNKSSKQARDKHNAQYLRKRRQGETTAFELLPEIKLGDFRRWPRPLMLESDTVANLVRPAPQLVTRTPFASVDSIPF